MRLSVQIFVGRKDWLVVKHIYMRFEVYGAKSAVCCTKRSTCTFSKLALHHVPLKRTGTKENMTFIAVHFSTLAAAGEIELAVSGS